MIEYKGYQIPNTREEIIKMNEELNTKPGFLMSEILWKDNKRSTPLSTIGMEDFTRTSNEDEINSMINEYHNIIFSYINLVEKN